MDAVTIPLWAFVLLAIVSIWAVLDRILIPSTRWLLRRRLNRMIDEISRRLDIEIRPFQLTKRQVLIDRLVYDPKVLSAIQAEARQRDAPRELIQSEVFTYAKEIVPSFNAYLYFRLGYWLAKKIAGLLYRVRVGIVDNAQLSTIDTESTVVFVMNHRSNMDYIIVAFLVAERTTLSYAVGEWAKIWPLHTLIRAMGAFFVRRRSRNRLYRCVLERYVSMATKEGVCQAVFLEGGLSRDGRLQPPKMGIIDYMLRSYDPEKDRDIVMVPVGINYDRTLEDRSLLRMLDPTAEKRSKWFIMKTTFRFIWRSLVLMALSRWKRYGYACVNFGPQISMRDYCRRQHINFSRLKRNDRFPQIEKLCTQIMTSIATVIPVLPVSLVASVFASHPKDVLNAAEVEAKVNQRIDALQAQGAPIVASKRSHSTHVITALDMLITRRFIVETDGGYQAEQEMLDVLTYYANAIDHWEEAPSHTPPIP